MIELERVPIDKLSWWLAGEEHGYLAGARVAEDEFFAPIEQAARDSVRRYATNPPRDELEELRGNPDHAQAIREYWELTGLRIRQPQPTPLTMRDREALIQRCRASWGLPTVEAVAA
ncbi:hypothetical protein [Kineococcus sp. SYSU DK002]|uniref:hypothetical protein n=1 Tax=Kineococcus sp. SYSU DK002 TaxID=3383123 RepID=UPI003D7C8423